METYGMGKECTNKTGELGLITDVQHFSIHDGPGIRTTVFLKGCPLRCFWCHNPETWTGKPVIQFLEEKCTGCGGCSSVSPGVMKVNPDGSHAFQFELCTLPEACAQACNYDALEIRGKWWTQEVLFNRLMKDISYYKNSGGGITLSGGEPLLQRVFCLEVLRRCKGAGLHTAIETSAYCKWDELNSLLPWLDLVIMDIKHMDEEMHIRGTGVSNRLIFENAQKINETGTALLIRTPVVPGFNDTVEAIGDIAEYIRTFGNLVNYELMPFHNMAKGKYKGLGLEYKAEAYVKPEEDTMKALEQCIKEKLFHIF